jgi:hypothetical protein
MPVVGNSRGNSRKIGAHPCFQHNPLAQVNRLTTNGLFCVSIIPIDQIEWSTHLILVYWKKCNDGWTTKRVLDLCRSFLVNSYLCYEDHCLL